MMDNTVPPFSIAAGTRITVYSPEDLVVSCTDETKKCYFNKTAQKEKLEMMDANERADWRDSQKVEVDMNDPSWMGQVRGFNLQQYCDGNTVRQDKINDIYNKGMDYRTVLFYCQSNQYQAINNAKQDAIYQNQQAQFQNSYEVKNTGQGITGIQGDQAYNEQVLGLTYNEDGSIQNPFQDTTTVTEEVIDQIMCEGNVAPDVNGCCPGEIYTDMGEQGFNCCPTSGGDCFPPIL